MIFRLDYRLTIPAAKSITGQTVQVPPVDFLMTVGPVLEVVIMPGKAIRDGFEQAGKPFPSMTATAMIDTGASGSVISPAIAAQLGLKQTGLQNVASVNNQQNQPVYYGGIGFSWGRAFDTGLVACPIVGCDCLIGRDILRFWYFTYDGPNGSIVICD